MEGRMKVSLTVTVVEKDPKFLRLLMVKAF